MKSLPPSSILVQERLRAQGRVSWTCAGEGREGWNRSQGGRGIVAHVCVLDLLLDLLSYAVWAERYYYRGSF